MDSCSPETSEIVKQVLALSIGELPNERPHKVLPLVELKDRLGRNVRSLKAVVNTPKTVAIDFSPTKLESTVKSLAAELRWRQLEGPQVEEAQPAVPNYFASSSGDSAPQVQQLMRPAQRTTQGSRQLGALAGSKAPQLPLRPVDTLKATQAAVGTSKAAAVSSKGGNKRCIDCHEEFADVAANVFCLTCRRKQPMSAAAQRACQTRPAVLRISEAPRLRSTPAAGAAPSVPTNRGMPASVAANTFYAPKGGGGSQQQAPIIGPQASVEPQQRLGQHQTNRRQQAPGHTVGANRIRQQQNAPGHNRSMSDVADEDDRQPGRRGAGTQKQRGRRSVPVEPEDKEPIVLVDSSDEEEDADGGKRAKTGGAAGLGPSSAAAAAAGGSGAATRQGNRSFRSLSVQLEGVKCCFPARGGKHSVEVTAEDLARLEKGEFLNDTCIDFYIKYMEHHLQPDVRSRYHFFNSFFLKKLEEKADTKGVKMLKAERMRQNHERVKKWTKHVDLFSKDYIFVPIHGDLHWSLVLICHPGNVVNELEQYRAPAGKDGGRSHQAALAGSPLLLHLDSLDGNHAPKSLFEPLRSYLEHEWAQKAADETRDSVPRRWAERFRAAGREPPRVRFNTDSLPGISMAARLPKQNNHTDCGLFLLSYMDFFIAANPRCMLLDGGANAEHVRALDPVASAANVETLLQKNWFKKSNAARLRDYLRMLICDLMREQVPAEDERHKTVECVVDDYNKQPCAMGLRYLKPAEYLRYLGEHPDEPEPTLDDDVLSSGPDSEGPIKGVLPSSSRRLTRAAAKQGNIKPVEALTSWAAGNKRRRAPAATDAGPSSRSADASKSVVDLSSPDKTADVLKPPVEQAPGSGVEAATVNGACSAQSEGLEPMEVDCGEEEEDEVAQVDPTLHVGVVVNIPQVPLQQPGGGDQDGTAGPAVKRRRHEANATNLVVVQGPSVVHNRQAESALEQDAAEQDIANKHQAPLPGPGAAADVSDSTGSDVECEPPPRQRQQRKRAPNHYVDPSDLKFGPRQRGSSGMECIAALAKTDVSIPQTQSQEDPETLPGGASLRSGPLDVAEEPLLAGEEDVDAGSGSTGSEGRSEGRALSKQSAGSRRTKAGSAATRGAQEHAQAEEPVPAAVRPVAGGAAVRCRGAPPADRAWAARSVQAASCPLEHPLDGLVPGDNYDASEDIGDDAGDPEWLRHYLPAGYSRDSSDSEEEERPAAALASKRAQKQQEPRLAIRAPSPGVHGGASMEPLAAYRTHTRWPEDDTESVERVPIRLEEVGEEQPGPAGAVHRPGSPHNGAHAAPQAAQLSTAGGSTQHGFPTTGQIAPHPPVAASGHTGAADTQAAGPGQPGRGDAAAASRGRLACADHQQGHVCSSQPDGELAAMARPPHGGRPPQAQAPSASVVAAAAAPAGPQRRVSQVSRLARQQLAPCRAARNGVGRTTAEPRVAAAPTARNAGPAAATAADATPLAEKPAGLMRVGGPCQQQEDEDDEGEEGGDFSANLEYRVIVGTRLPDAAAQPEQQPASAALPLHGVQPAAGLGPGGPHAAGMRRQSPNSQHHYHCQEPSQHCLQYAPTRAAGCFAQVWQQAGPEMLIGGVHDRQAEPKPDSQQQAAALPAASTTAAASCNDSWTASEPVVAGHQERSRLQAAGAIAGQPQAVAGSQRSSHAMAAPSQNKIKLAKARSRKWMGAEHSQQRVPGLPDSPRGAAAGGPAAAIKPQGGAAATPVPSCTENAAEGGYPFLCSSGRPRLLQLSSSGDLRQIQAPAEWRCCAGHQPRSQPQPHPQVQPPPDADGETPELLADLDGISLRASASPQFAQQQPASVPSQEGHPPLRLELHDGDGPGEQQQLQHHPEQLHVVDGDSLFMDEEDGLQALRSAAAGTGARTVLPAGTQLGRGAGVTKRSRAATTNAQNAPNRAPGTPLGGTRLAAAAGSPGTAHTAPDRADMGAVLNSVLGVGRATYTYTGRADADLEPVAGQPNKAAVLRQQGEDLDVVMADAESPDLQRFCSGDTLGQGTAVACEAAGCAAAADGVPQPLPALHAAAIVTSKRPNALSQHVAGVEERLQGQEGQGAGAAMRTGGGGGPSQVGRGHGTEAAQLINDSADEAMDEDEENSQDLVEPNVEDDQAEVEAEDDGWDVSCKSGGSGGAGAGAGKMMGTAPALGKQSRRQPQEGPDGAAAGPRRARGRGRGGGRGSRGGRPSSSTKGVTPSSGLSTGGQAAGRKAGRRSSAAAARAGGGGPSRGSKHPSQSGGLGGASSAGYTINDYLRQNVTRTQNSPHVAEVVHDAPVDLTADD